MQSSLIQALGIVDCSILRRMDNGQFEVLHLNEQWLYDLLPETREGGLVTLGDNSAFLTDFLIDAEIFWLKGESGQIHSGIWSEHTQDKVLRLEASAANEDGQHFLVISNLQQEFERQQKTLQVARELLLSNDRVMAQHEYLHERLDAQLKQTHDLQHLQAPIQQAIENAPFAVFILDANFQLKSCNPACYDMFEARPDQRTLPFDELRRLFDSQCPEFERVQFSKSRWNGELFWHKPPTISKWLQVAMYPVLDDNLHLRSWLLLVTDVTKLKYLLQANEKLSLYDSITRLPNRQFFWQMLEQHIEAERPLFVIYLNIKHFKRVNELHGHQAGDDLLVELAGRLSVICGESRPLARMAGDEFALLIPDTEHHADCTPLLSDILDAIETPFYLSGSQKCQLELSIGAAQYPLDAPNSEDLMRFADLALQMAKQKNKTAIEFYSHDLKEASRRRHELERELREAIDREEFELYLQPMLDLETGDIIKAEALLRWHRRDGVSISPSEFIPIAEQTGLIVPLGKWVISRACKVLKILQQHKESIKLSINLSPRQVNDRRLFEYIDSMVKLSQINPHHLELELTEGVLVDSYEKINYLLKSARKIGIHVSIDDFGTGYSSLAYLQKLPIDHLKIDRTFVKDLDTNDNDKAIILAVIAMAHSLKLGVIAEGVETNAQREFLKENHCDGAQGFLFSKPLPVDEFCQLLLNETRWKR